MNKEPKEWFECPRCHRPYSFMRPRWTDYGPDGNKRDLCLECSCLAAKELSTPERIVNDGTLGL